MKILYLEEEKISLNAHHLKETRKSNVSVSEGQYTNKQGESMYNLQGEIEV